MTSYIEGALINDEKVLYEGSISLWSLAHLIVLGGLLIPLGINLMFHGKVSFGFWLWGLAFFVWASVYIRYKTTELAFTNKRVIAKFGFISRKTVEMNISKVESIQVNQDILGRIFNFGTLVISGAGNPQAPIPGISDPMVFRREFMKFQDSSTEKQA